MRTDERGHIVGAVMEDSRWVDDRTFEIDVRRGVRFQDGEEARRWLLETRSELDAA